MSDSPIASRELVLTRIFDASPDKLYRAWTDPELMKQWFVPRPWTVVRAELDVRPGGSCLVVMADPDGNEHPNPGVYLDLVPNRKIVFTDAFVAAWEPSQKPFMCATITFEDIGSGQTRYTARVLHWSEEDTTKHEAMGFHRGWGQAADQLAEVVATM